ncbi:MAG: hypothetical protein KDD65_10905 [Bacteroidetes bacterium]|nr:hypothetical protein [Bacteroidota bacterium]
MPTSDVDLPVRRLFGRVRPWLLLALVPLGLLTAACERPFVEESTPDIKVTSPNLAVAVIPSDITIRVESQSFREVTQVRANGLEMEKSGVGDWTVNLKFVRGLNVIRIEAMDSEMATSVDSFYIFRAEPSVSTFAPRLPTGLGGIAATLGSNNQVVVTGGAQAPGAPGVNSVYVLAPNGTDFITQNFTLLHARVGHTASLLPDNRILVVGGGSRENVTAIDQLVENAEVIDLESGTTKEVPVVGQPIRRLYHTANVRATNNGTVLDLYGGIGDISYTSSARLGIRSDLRRFFFVRDTLFAVDPGIGPRLGPPVYGHSQTRLNSAAPFFQNRFAYFGAFFAANVNDPISFEADFDTPSGILTSDLPRPNQLRINHADALASNRIVALFGGRTGASSRTTTSAELFSDEAGRFFSLPFVSSEPIRRYAHKALRLPDGSIMLIGGFNDAGNGISASEIVSLGF